MKFSVEIRKNLLANKFGMIRNISGHPNSNDDWHTGHLKRSGYLEISIPGTRKTILAHRLIAEAFIPNPGHLPQVDHINNDRLDNRVENLRWVTNRENHQNRPNHRAGKLVGATFVKCSGNWKSRIKINEKQIYLGTFPTELEAHQAYKKALDNL